MLLITVALGLLLTKSYLHCKSICFLGLVDILDGYQCSSGYSVKSDGDDNSRWYVLNNERIKNALVDGLPRNRIFCL